MKLKNAIEGYVEWKRRNGYSFERGESTLLAFAKIMGSLELDAIRAEDILKFLNNVPISTITWRLKYWVLFRFFEHWSNREAMPTLVMPTPKPMVRQSFVPYVFTRAELRSLLEAASQNERSTCRLDPTTLRTILIFLYGTGASVGEMKNLSLADISFEKSTVMIRSPRSNRSREIPIGPDLTGVLSRYIKWRLESANQSLYLFINRAGCQIEPESIAKNFKRLRRTARVFRRDGSAYQPRVDDLRYTFAVHRITNWLEKGADLNRMLPALAAYMGQIGLGSTERYLFLTPERFRKNLDKLSPIQGNGKWRDNHMLIEFLGTL